MFLLQAPEVTVSIYSQVSASSLSSIVSWPLQQATLTMSFWHVSQTISQKDSSNPKHSVSSQTAGVSTRLSVTSWVSAPRLSLAVTRRRCVTGDCRGVPACQGGSGRVRAHWPCGSCCRCRCKSRAASRSGSLRPRRLGTGCPCSASRSSGRSASCHSSGSRCCSGFDGCCSAGTGSSCLTTSYYIDWPTQPRKLMEPAVSQDYPIC